MTTRTLFQILRQNANPNLRDAYYAPNRDLAHIGAGLVRMSLGTFDECWYEPWFKEFMTAHQLDEKALQPAMLTLAKMVKLVGQQTDPIKAAAVSGFDQLPYAVQVAIYTRIGQVALGGVWAAVQDVKRPGDAPPLAWSELLDQLESMFSQNEAENATVSAVGYSTLS